MKIIKKFISILLALGVFVGTFVLEQEAFGLEQIAQSSSAIFYADSTKAQVLQNKKIKPFSHPDKTEIVPGEIIETLDTDSAYVMQGESIIRLAPQTSLEFLFYDAEQKDFLFRLLKGKIWIYNLLSDAHIHVLSGGAYIVPEQSVLNIEYADQKTKMHALQRRTHINLVPLDYSPQNISNVGSADFINHFPLFQGNQVTIFDSKIEKNADILRRLYYSKLIKEFQYGLFDFNELQKDQWISTNMAKDKAFFQERSMFFLKEIQTKGLLTTIDDDSLQQKLLDLSNALTFFEDKRIKRSIVHASDHFDDVRYLAVFGRSEVASEHLEHFQRVQKNLEKYDPLYRKMFIEVLEEKLAELSFVTPLEPLYFSKKIAIEELLKDFSNSEEQFPEKMLLVHRFLEDAYAMAEKSPQLARVSLEEYFKQMNSLLQNKPVQLENFAQLLSDEHRDLDNLFFQYPAFYRDNLFASKYQFEQQFLNALPEDQKLEERQNIIANKIEFLRKLKEFFLADKVELDSARQIVFRLFREADSLQLPTSAQLAVNELFAKRLDDYGIFFRYLNSPEYSSTTLHGSTNQIRYNKFLNDQQEQITIDELREEILGVDSNNQRTLTPEEIIQQVQKDFEAANITSLQLGALNSSEQALVRVESAVLEKYSFKGVYDWNKKLLSQIEVNGVSLSNETVRLSNLKLLFQSRLEQPTRPKPKPKVEDSTAEDAALETPTAPNTQNERVTKILLIQRLKSLKISVSEQDIVVEDLSAGKFTISNAKLMENEEVSFSFKLSGKERTVSELNVVTSEGEKRSEKSLNLEEIVGEVQALVSES